MNWIKEVLSRPITIKGILKVVVLYLLVQLIYGQGYKAGVGDGVAFMMQRQAEAPSTDGEPGHFGPSTKSF